MNRLPAELTNEWNELKLPFDHFAEQSLKESINQITQKVGKLTEQIKIVVGGMSTGACPTNWTYACCNNAYIAGNNFNISEIFAELIQKRKKLKKFHTGYVIPKLTNYGNAKIFQVNF